MSEKPTVVIDIDGVLAEFTYKFTELAHEISSGFSPEPWSSGSQKSWEFPFSKALSDACWNVIDEDPRWWARLPLIPTESEVQELHLLRRKANIVYLTGRLDKGDVETRTRYWLSKHNFPEGKLDFATKKMDYLSSKGINPVSIIDDKPSTINVLHDSNYNIVARDWPYNRHLEGVPRVASISEWISYVYETIGSTV